MIADIKLKLDVIVIKALVWRLFNPTKYVFFKFISKWKLELFRFDPPTSYVCDFLYITISFC